MSLVASHTVTVTQPTFTDTTTPIKRLSPSCQQIISETFTSTSAHVIIRSCIADSALLPVIEGHKCNMVAVCPSALYADMALTIGDYVWKALRLKIDVPGLNIGGMKVPRSFLPEMPQKAPGEFLEVEAVATLEETASTLGSISFAFRTVEPEGAKLHDHGDCWLRYESRRDWQEQWSRSDFLVRDRIQTLRQSPDVTRMQRGLAYKTFASFVNYSPKYFSMSEVCFSGLEGTALVDFQTGASDFCGPFHLDGTCHLSGFLCNALDSEEESFYISEGWDAMRFVDHRRVLSSDLRSVRNYVRMQDKPKSIVQGDVYVFEGEAMIGIWEGIRFKRMPRRVLDVLLPRGG